MSILGAMLPIVVSAVLVFILSAIIHMVLKYHNSDYKRLPNEDAVRAALRSGNPEPGRQYIFPYAAEMKECASPEMQQKFAEGPVGVLYLRRPGPPTMGPALAQWFLFTLWVSLLIAYVGSRTIQPGAAYLDVFCTVGAVTFLAYAAGVLPASIWMGKPWAVTAKEMFDGLLYALVTAGTFGWLWPR